MTQSKRKADINYPSIVSILLVMSDEANDQDYWL